MIGTYIIKESKNKKLNGIKPAEIINKKFQISHVKKEILPLQKPLDHAYKEQNFYQFKVDNHTQKNVRINWFSSFV